MKKKCLNLFLIIIFISILAVFALFVVRFFSPREIDDVTPGIPCSQGLVEKSDILWIIPDFENNSIANPENAYWCEYILSLNKTLGLHGVYHTYNEFYYPRNYSYLKKGIDDFKKCFGFAPTMFKPPQINISAENKKLILNSGLELKGSFNQVTHKVYHCVDYGIFPNKFVDLF